MAENIEIKLRVADWRDLLQRLRALDGIRDEGVLEQRDVFFDCPSGRLKLRLVTGLPAQLIHYERADAAALRSSRYTLIEIPDGEDLGAVLQLALGTRGEVCKRRHLFLLDNVRIHLDEVHALGRFVELEAVVDAQHDQAACLAAAQRLLQKLGLDRAPRESHAYIDLLQGGSAD